MKIKILEIAAFFAFLVCVIISMSSFENNCVGIKNSVLRLHVIANSDSQDDQQLKLKVRDELLLRGKEVFSVSSTKAQASNLLNGNISFLEKTAEEIIKENGLNYDVKVFLGKSYFPTKTYENITFPAGTYDALKVIIGKGEGKNWWCVMFPPLCLPAAKGQEKKLDDVLNEDEIKLVESNPKYDIRFWIVEKIENFKNKISN